MAIMQRTFTVIGVTPVCDTSAYAAGDTLFDATAVTGFTWDLDAPMKLVSMVVLDEDDQVACGMTVYFFSTAISTFGTFNAAPSISDANARTCLGYVDIEANEWRDIGGSKVATIRDINLIIAPVAADTKFYIAATTQGTPTQTASGLKFRFGFES
jgi:hypothetical protein